MRKALSLFLVFTLFIPMLAFADSGFSVRNGIHFGDSKATVISKEASTPSEEYSNDVTYDFQNNGYEGTVEYIFNGADALNDVLVQYRYSIKSELLSHSSVLKDDLISKFGNPIPQEEKHWKTLVGPGLERAVRLIEAYEKLSTSQETYDGGLGEVLEWVVIINNVPVKIELVTYYLSSYFQNTKATIYNYFTIIAYHKYTQKEEINDAKVRMANNITDYKVFDEKVMDKVVKKNDTASNEVPAHTEFKLHSGVTFGMSMDEVKKIEEEAGFSVKTDNQQQYCYYCYYFCLQNRFDHL